MPRAILWCMVALAGCTRERTGRLPNIILITLDTTRADGLGCYGNPRNVTPTLDALAREASVYTRAHATSSWTLPSHASLFTGKFPSSHGAGYAADGNLRLSDALGESDYYDKHQVAALADSEVTLAEMLRDAGYRTAGVVAGPWLKRIFGLAQGFDDWDDADIADLGGRPAMVVTQHAVDWLAQHDRRPFFLFLNYFDVHTPYRPPRQNLARFLPAARLDPASWTQDDRRSLYDAELNAVDDALAVLFRFVAGAGLWQSTYLIVTADHGELLGEHGLFGHGTTLTEPELWVPLVCKRPGTHAAERVATPIQLLDLLPMVLSEIGLPIADGVEGRVPGRDPQPSFAEVAPPASLSHAGSWQAFYDGDYKLLRGSLGTRMLVNLRCDPGETTNLADQERARLEHMLERLASFTATLSLPRAAPIARPDPGTREALRALGYWR